eukprot:gnl/Chilomastix_cuspidata/2323.p1 GENE.gnl/Chilomastix_cuspidata/2323~~gnl/Chilomastix_cuspidata/2323.p1  ORF type:complete len:850 (+),score=142.16 gnl/Chilomastix_cuspidata/2323:86-2551(+)
MTDLERSASSEKPIVPLSTVGPARHVQEGVGFQMGDAPPSQEGKERTLFKDRPMQNRELAAVSYIRNLCKQLKCLITQHDGERSDKNKPTVNALVGAMGSGKSLFLNSFFQPIANKERGEMRELVNEIRSEFPRVTSPGSRPPQKSIYDAEFKLIMYLVFSGRFIVTNAVYNGQALVKKILDAANKESAEQIHVPPALRPAEAVAHIAANFRPKPFEELLELWQDKCLSHKAVKSEDLKPLLGPCIPTRTDSAETRALGLLNRHAPKPFDSLPLLISVDELSEERSVFDLMKKTLSRGGTRASLFSCAGVYEKYIQRGAISSQLFIKPYRLGSILKRKDIIGMVRTAPELGAARREIDEDRAYRELLLSGGNPRVMVNIITNFARSGKWEISWSPSSESDVTHLHLPLRSLVTNRVVMATLSGLPVHIGAEVLLSGLIEEKLTRFADLEYEKLSLAPAFVHPTPSRDPENSYELTRFHQIVGPVVRPTRGCPEFEQFEKLYKDFYGLFEELLENKVGEERGIAFEGMIAAVWQMRAHLCTTFLDQTSAERRDELMQDISKYERTIEILKKSSKPSKTVGLIERYKKDISNIHKKLIPKCVPENVFGVLGFPSLVPFARRDRAWGEFLGVEALVVSSETAPRVLDKRWANSRFDPSYEGESITCPGELPRSIFFFNAKDAPAPDIGLRTVGFKGGERKELLIAFDVKLSLAQPESDAKKEARTEREIPQTAFPFADQAVKALACTPCPTHIVSVRALPSEKPLFDAFKNFHENRERWLKAVCDMYGILFQESWLDVKHIVVGQETLGTIFESFVAELRAAKR